MQGIKHTILNLIPYSQKYWQELNLPLKNIDGFKVGSLVRDHHMHIYMYKYEILADSFAVAKVDRPPNHQATKFNFPPNFLAIQYLHVYAILIISTLKRYVRLDSLNFQEANFICQIIDNKGESRDWNAVYVHAYWRMLDTITWLSKFANHTISLYLGRQHFCPLRRAWYTSNRCARCPETKGRSRWLFRTSLNETHGLAVVGFSYDLYTV